MTAAEAPGAAEAKAPHSTMTLEEERRGGGGGGGGGGGSRKQLRKG